MILGLGTDIVTVSRIRDMLEKHESSFMKRVFCDEELLEFHSRKSGEMYLAGRWAAKEAASKALGVGMGEQCGWKDISIGNDAAGKPQLSLSGKAAELAQSMRVSAIHVSISHEKEHAVSCVILEGD